MKNNNTFDQDALNADSLHQATLLDDQGNEQIITREMINEAINQLAEPETKPKS